MNFIFFSGSSKYEHSGSRERYLPVSAETFLHRRLKMEKIIISSLARLVFIGS